MADHGSSMLSSVTCTSPICPLSLSAFWLTDKLKRIEEQGTLPYATTTQEKSGLDVLLMVLKQKEGTLTNINNGETVSDSKRQKTRKIQKSEPVHNNDVFSTMFGPKRRQAKPLPVVPAERQTCSIAEMKRILVMKRELQISILNVSFEGAVFYNQWSADACSL